MNFSLVICTYMRPKPLLALLESVSLQSSFPNEILVVDASLNDATKHILDANNFRGLKYFKVLERNRGLTKQRNFGIANVSQEAEVVCFLDDDTILPNTYFENLLATYTIYPDALGVGGYIANDGVWKLLTSEGKFTINQFTYDGWVREDGSRYVLRKILGLDSDRPPAYFPYFAHGRSVSFLPPSGKTYPVEQFMGGVSSYKTDALRKQMFSEYFEGYGLYEDADYTLRLSKKGKLFVNTSAYLYHYHDSSGRPNKFIYGKMVVRNGWYVWRVKYPNPTLKARLKWNVISFLLTSIRFSNVFTQKERKEAFTEAIGRTVGWFSLLINKPKVK